MSGGSYDYVEHRLNDCASTLRARHRDMPHVMALAALLDELSGVMHDIEWADSGDTSWNDALDAKIRQIVSPAQELQVTIDDAKLAESALHTALTRALAHVQG